MSVCMCICMYVCMYVCVCVYVFMYAADAAILNTMSQRTMYTTFFVPAIAQAASRDPEIRCHLLYLLTYSLTYLLTYSFTHLLTYSFTHLLTYSFTHLLTYSLTHLFTYSLTGRRYLNMAVQQHGVISEQTVL